MGVTIRNGNKITNDSVSVVGEEYTPEYISFQECPTETLTLKGLNTSKITDMYQMFYNCSALTTLDLSSFDTSNVTSMGAMFQNCSALTTLDLSSFVFNATVYSSMFSGVPDDCLIYVKDQTAKDWITSKFTNLTNVQIKGE